MNFSVNEKWPPVYDFEDLQKRIQELLRSDIGNLFDGFFTTPHDREPSFCQGDIIRLESDFPYIDKEMGISCIQGSDYWVILGNTCDLFRQVTDCSHTQICPLRPLEHDAPMDVINPLQQYKPFRKFYIPCWTAADQLKGYTADLTHICTVEKMCLSQRTFVTRMTRLSWVLLHSCLVRYFARGDDRHS